jgi:hypothetical protein
MQKEQNVINLAIILLFLVISDFSFSQNLLSGTFSNLARHQEYYNSYTFNENGEFYYHSGASSGNFYFGKGEYQIENGNLILNYNKTNPLKIGHHVSEIWQNKADSIAVHFSFFDFDNNPIPYVNFFYQDSLSKKGYQGGVANKDGQGLIKLKKDKKDIMLTVSNIGFRQYTFQINRNYNFDVSVFLETQGNGIPIKNQIDTLRLIEIKENSFKVIEKDGKITTWLKR